MATKNKDKIRRRIEAAHLAGIEEGRRAERARCLELIKRCNKVYQREAWREEEEARQFYGPLRPPGKWYLSGMAEMLAHRVAACDYVEMVVKHVDLESNRMPMPY